VAVESRDGGVRIAVRGRRIGIAPLEQRRIFGKFYRVDPGLARCVGAPGLAFTSAGNSSAGWNGRLSVSSEKARARRSPSTCPLPQRGQRAAAWRRPPNQEHSIGPMAAPIRVGVCSWADETLTKVWYPKGVKSATRLVRCTCEFASTTVKRSH